MKQKIIYILLVAIVLTVIIFAAGCSTKKETTSQINNGLNRGDKAPEFTVTTIDGEIIKLSEIMAQNKPILVEFITTWCPFCKQDLDAVNRVYPKYNKDVEFVAIDLDLNEDAQKLREYKIRGNYDLIKFAPGSSSILKDYEIISTTVKFAIDRRGIIIWAGSGAVDNDTWEIIFKRLVNS